MFWASLPLAAAVLAADGWRAVGGGLWCLVMLAGVWARAWRWCAVAAVVSLLAGGLHGWRMACQREMAERAWALRVPVGLEGEVWREPEAGVGTWSALVRVTDSVGMVPPLRGFVWWEGRGELPRQGSRVRASGRMAQAPELRNPGGFDRRSWLHRQGTDVVFHAESGTQQVATGWWARESTDFRAAFRRAVTAGLDPDGREAHVIRAMVLGDMPRGDDRLVDAFRRSGTLHIFAVSGQQVAMVGMFLWFLLGWCRVPRRAAVCLLIPIIFGYAWLTGMSPPAARAAWMAACYLGGFLLRRRPDLLNSLGVVLAGGMLWDGHVLFLPGVQLSYLVVAVIGVAAAWCGRLSVRWVPRELYLPRSLTGVWRERWLGIRRAFVLSSGVSVAAWLGSAPLCAWHFGVLTPVSMVATPVLSPLVFVLLSVSLVSSAVYPLAPGVAAWINGWNGRVARAGVAVAEGFAAVPGGNLSVHGMIERDPGLLVMDLPRGGGADAWMAGTCGVLVDTGDDPGFHRVVLPALRYWGVDADAVVISHPDGGHFGAGASVFEALPVRQVLLPAGGARSPAWRGWRDGAARAGALLGETRTGQVLPLAGGGTLTVVFAPSAALAMAAADERVAVFLLECRGWRVLLTNDLGEAGERALLQTGADLHADVVITGRNRNGWPLSDAFLRSVAPRAVVATHAEIPSTERIPDAWVTTLEARGVAVFHQGRTGAVTLRFRRASLDMESFLTPRLLRLPRLLPTAAAGPSPAGVG